MIDTQTIIAEELEQLKTDIIAASESQGQKASGDTYKSMLVEDVTSTSGTLTGRFAIGTLATGRKSGKVPENMHEIIMQWARDKGISFSDEEELVKFGKAVAWKIRKQGTELHKEVGGGELPDIFEVPINAFLDRIIKRIPTVIVLDAMERIDKTLKLF